LHENNSEKGSYFYTNEDSLFKGLDIWRYFPSQEEEAEEPEHVDECYKCYEKDFNLQSQPFFLDLYITGNSIS
jgi:hypothetical protein